MDSFVSDDIYEHVSRTCADYSCLFPAIVEAYQLFHNASEVTDEYGEITYNGNYLNCTGDTDQVEELRYFLIFPSLLVLLVLAAITRRVAARGNGFSCRPELSLPMEMLERHDHMVEYTVAFLATSEDIFVAIFEGSKMFDPVVPILKFLIKLLMVFFFSITYYPVFTGIKHHRLVGYLLALCVALLLFAFDVAIAFYEMQCITAEKSIPFVFTYLLSWGFDVALIIIFLYRIIMHVKWNGCIMTKEISPNTGTKDYWFTYVRELLKNGCIQRSESTREASSEMKEMLEHLRCNEMKGKIKQKVYKEIPGFSLPPRLIIGIFVGLYFAYRIFIEAIYEMTPVAWKLIWQIERLYSTTETNISSAFNIIVEGNFSRYSNKQVLNSFRFLVLFYFNTTIGCITYSVIASFFISIFQCFLIVRSYRLKFYRLTRKGFSSMVSLNKAPEPYSLVLGFVRFSGFQAAYILWAIIAMIVFQFVVVFFLVAIFLVPLFYVKDSWSRKVVMLYGPVILATVVFNFIQTLIVKHVFVKEKGRLMEINNRNAFTIYSHVVFFLNAMMGIFSSIKKAIVWVVSGVFCLGRIDFTTLPEYLKGCDGGYMSFIGFIYTEQYHHNPILRCFVCLLLENSSYLDSGINQKETLLGCAKENEILLERCKGRPKMYRNKWLVAFTLINNQRLASERKSSFKSLAS